MTAYEVPAKKKRLLMKLKLHEKVSHLDWKRKPITKATLSGAFTDFLMDWGSYCISDMLGLNVIYMH